MKKSTLGIIGVGGIVKTMHLPILHCLPDVQVSYLADLTEVSAEAKALGARAIRLSRDGQPELPASDLVFIATPVGVRQPYLASLAPSGVAIMTEKPFATTLAEHEAILSLTSRIYGNYNRKFYPSLATLRGLIASQCLGALREVSMTEEVSPRGTGKGSGHYQFTRTLSGGGILAERGCHTLSQLDVLFPEADYRIETAAMVAVADIEIDVDFHFSLLAERGSIPFHYRLSAGNSLPTESRYRFERATICFDHTNPESPLQLEDDRGQRYHLQQAESRPMNNTQSFIASWQCFLQKARTGDFNPAQDTSLRTSALISGAYTQAGLV